MSCRILLRCVGMAIADKGMRGLMGAIPFGECFYDIASGAYDRYTRECRVESRMEEIASAAASSMDQIKDQARDVLAEIRQKADPELRAKLDDPLVQNNMLGYLEQIPGAVRASLKRPSDPSGKSLPKSFTLSSADDFLKILPTRPPRFKAGDMPVGNWKLLDLLGVGGFGEVWKAEHPSLKGIPPVALKFCLSPDSARFLRHEGELLSRVMEVSANNPGIVKLRQAYIESDTPCLEYEFINGGDLCGLMSEWLNMPKERRTLLALQMLLKLARTIAPLHTMNPPIVHRDLKPANVLVVRTADGKINLKIGDFGIGGLATKQAIEGQSKGASQGEILTQTLRGSHTPLYAGPEQQRGDPPHPTDDVHALGVIGFQLLVCDLRRGPTGDWDEELRELGVSDPIIAMFKQCIARQARRYPHAGALADELQNLIDSKPSTAAKPALPVPPKISANPVDALVGLAAIAPPQIPFNKEIERPTEKRSKKTQSNLSNDKEPISPNENLTEKVIAAIFIGIIISIALSGILFFAISARRHAEEQRLADIKKREAAEIASAQQENIKKSIELENEKTINQKIDKLKSKIVGAWKSADNNLFVEFTNNTFIFSSVSHKINNETKTIQHCGLQNGALTLGLGYWVLLVDFVSDNEISISNDIGKTEIFGLLQGKFSRSDSEEIKKLYKLSAEKSGKNNRTNSIMPNSGNLFPPGGFPGQSAPSEPPLTPPGGR